MSALRPIAAVGTLTLRGIEPNDIANEATPTVMWVDPRQLLVDPTYQRDLHQSSMALIRKIIAGWSWRKFKPPIVALSDRGYEIIDGQHTAIAAASHPQVDKIPVLVVQAADLAARADGFLGHNRDRVGITPMQLFHSSAVAGDPVARIVKEVCAAAGVAILRNPVNGTYPVNSTVAVASLVRLVKRRGAADARRVLEVVNKVGAAPISANQMKAVEALIWDSEFNAEGRDGAIVEAIRRLGAGGDRQASVFATTHGIPLWKALTIIIYREMRKRRAA